MVVRLKFKGIDGGPYKWWNMWFNLIQCVEFYPDLIFLESSRDRGVPSGELGDRCCMAVVSSCCEMLG